MRVCQPDLSRAHSGRCGLLSQSGWRAAAPRCGKVLILEDGRPHWAASAGALRRGGGTGTRPERGGWQAGGGAARPAALTRLRGLRSQGGLGPPPPLVPRPRAQPGEPWRKEATAARHARLAASSTAALYASAQPRGGERSGRRPAERAAPAESRRGEAGEAPGEAGAKEHARLRRPPWPRPPLWCGGSSPAAPQLHSPRSRVAARAGRAAGGSGVRGLGSARAHSAGMGEPPPEPARWRCQPAARAACASARRSCTAAAWRAA